MGDRLGRIGEEYENKDKKSYSGGEFRSLFTGDFQEWRGPDGKKRPKVGDNFVKILPPKQDDIYFGLEIWAHWEVGDNRDPYLCPKKMKEVLMSKLDRKEEDLPKEIRDGKCPICEAQACMIKDLGGATYKGNRKIIDLFPSGRVVYMMIDDESDETRDSGIQIWSAPITKVNKEQIIPLCKIKKGKRAGEFVDVSLPDNEYTVCFSRQGTVKEDTSYGGFSLEPSDTSIDEVYEFAESLPEKFEDILSFSSYEEIADAFGMDEEEEAPRRGRKEEKEEESPRRSRRDSSAEEKEEDEDPEEERVRVKRELREKMEQRRSRRIRE